MEIIQVIDLKGGAVVHAKHGQRHSYQPIVSRLASTSAPDDVLAGLLRVHSFATIYIADLDAIEKNGDHSQCIAALAGSYPSIESWLDASRPPAVGCRYIRTVA